MLDLMEMDPAVWEYTEKKQTSRLFLVDIEDG
jgi:hypothetical protein